MHATLPFNPGTILDPLLRLEYDVDVEEHDHRRLYCSPPSRNVLHSDYIQRMKRLNKRLATYKNHV